MISQRTIEEVKDRASLLDIATEFVTLKRQGSSVVALCPFHPEKSPSFFVRDSGKFYHCFGCGASGNVISFLMQARGLSFPDAVEELAHRYGIKMELEGKAVVKKPTVDKEQFYKLNALAQDYFLRGLHSAPKPVIDYLHERGITREAVQAFGIGFAPGDKMGLAALCRSQGYSEDTLLKAGLIRRTEKGEIIDIFRNRITFPIVVERRRIAGFAGRIIAALLPEQFVKSAPKYLNSPETPVYEKSKTFFGMPQALDGIRKNSEIVLVEGHLDVVGLWQAGVKNAVATCGTAITLHHVKRLAHLVDRVTLLFDGDSAGQNAAGKSFEVFLNAGIDVSVLTLPPGDDPDTVALRHKEKTADFLFTCKKVPLFDAYIDSLIQKHGFKSVIELGSAAKGKIAEEVAQLLSQIKNLVERAELIERAALKLKIETPALIDLIKGTSAPRAAILPEPLSPSIAIKEVNQLPRSDRDILLVIMAKRLAAIDGILSDALLSSALDSATVEFIQRFTMVLREAGPDPKSATRELLKGFGSSWMALWKEAHDMMESGQVDFNAMLEGCRRAAWRMKSDMAIKALREELTMTEDESVKMELTEKLIKLEGRVKSGEIFKAA